MSILFSIAVSASAAELFPCLWAANLAFLTSSLERIKSKKFIMPYQEPKSYKFKPIPTDYSKDSEFKIDLTQVSKSYIGKFSKSEIVEDWPCRLALLTNDKMVYCSEHHDVAYQPLNQARQKRTNRKRFKVG